MAAHPGSRGLAAQPDEGFLDRFGDLIDDRVAMTVDEMLGQPETARQHAWLRPVLAAVVLSAALVASFLLRHDIGAACTIWPSAAVIYLAASRFAGGIRS